MNYKEKLVTFLKSNEEVKKKMEKLGYHHLMMFCEEKYSLIIESSFIRIVGANYNETFIDIDNTKDFDSQSEEVYKKIFLALNDLKNA